MKILRKNSIKLIKCVVFSCKSSSQDKIVRMVRFPDFGTQCFNEWLESTRLQLAKGTHYICSKHFHPHEFGLHQNRFSKRAIPSLNLGFVDNSRPCIPRTYERSIKTEVKATSKSSIEIIE